MPGSTYSLYDSNGNRVLVQEENLLDLKNITTRQMVYAADGTLLQKNDGTASSLSTMVNNKVQYASITAGGVAHHFSSNGNYLGEIAKDKAGRISSSLKDQHYTAPTQHDSSNVTQYQVQSGDSLKSLALNFYGNADYWYLIANLNGLTSSPDEALSAGLSIDIPARASSSNSANSFKPMDLQKIIGDTTPSLPYVPPAPAAGCNAVAMIVMIAITVVATIATAGAAMMAAPGALMSTGMTALAGGLGWAGAAAAAGGFVGSVAGQLAGKAMGVVDSFSLKNAFASGLTAGATAGLGNLMGVGSTASTTVNGAKAATSPFVTFADGATKATLNLAGKMTMAASAAGISVGANKLAGNNKASFQWRNVVTGAVTAGLMHKMGITDTESSWSKATNNLRFEADVLNGFAGAAVGYGVSKGLYNEGSWNFRNVATDVFGNALGNSIVKGLSSEGTLSGKEQAALDKKMAAMDRKIQAKLNGQSGATDPVIQMQSQNGVLVPQGSNPVEIFDWYQENGLLDGMDDKQYHNLALSANAYEDKQFARINASMNYSNYLDSKLAFMGFVSGQHKESNKNGRYERPLNLNVQKDAQRHIEKIWTSAVKMNGSAVFGTEDEAFHFFADHFTEPSAAIGPRGFEIASVTIHDAKGKVVLLPPHTDGLETTVDYLKNADAFKLFKDRDGILYETKAKNEITSIMHTHGVDRGGDNEFSLGDYEYYSSRLDNKISRDVAGYLAAPNGQRFKFNTVDYQNYVIKMGGADNFVPTYDAYKMFVQELKK